MKRYISGENVSEAELKKYFKAIKLASLYRGTIITSFLFLEHFIEKIIAAYFCGNDNRKQEEIKHVLIADKLDFSYKEKVLSYIITNHYSHYEKKYEKLLDKIRELQRLRNIVAHGKITPTIANLETYNNNDICFEVLSTDRLKLKNKPEIVNKERCDSLAEASDRILLILVDLLNEIERGNETKNRTIGV